MDYEELRPLVLEAIRLQMSSSSLQLIDIINQTQMSSSSLQLIDIINQTDTVARSKGFFVNATQWRYGGISTEHYMPIADREKVRQIVWEFILQGILAIGLNEMNPSFPFLSVTEHGRQVLESGQTLPYDPDGYLKRLNENPNLDPLIEMYASESLQAYLKGLMFSSAIMLGVASEEAFLILLETFTNALTDLTKQARFLKLQESMQTKHKFDQLKNEIMAIKANLPQDLSEDLESQFEGIFNLIRVTRNDAGHPTGRKIERGVAYTNLILFIHYCKRIYGLIDYFQNNRI
ncbi:MAG: hypothetical protein QG670_930 [Thermoproteota archaeon]|nr:hypothetical protein [Thermoproteota archaeon]